ncbi:protein of unknown function [Ruminococcaceae bacterium BL-6]|nr:protein of unknown function [Ruminococcaceae bacterium BL-6]
MLKKPIVLNKYDDEGKVEKSFKLCIIPWNMMKKFSAAMDELGENFKYTELLDRMDGIICDAFHRQFDENDLGEHFDAGEVVAAVNSIMDAIGNTNPNVMRALTKKAPASTIPTGGAVSN